MVRSHILSLVLLFVCATSVHSMEPGNNPKGKSGMDFLIEVVLPSVGAQIISSFIWPSTGMNPQDIPGKGLLFSETDAELLSGGLIIPTIESAVLSTVIGFTRALMSRSAKEALFCALGTGTGAGLMGLLVTIPVSILGFTLGADIDLRWYRAMNPNKSIPGLFQWKESQAIFLFFTALFTSNSFHCLWDQLIADGHFPH